MDQQLRQQRGELRLPQERLQQGRREKEDSLNGGNNRFSAFSNGSRAAAPAAPVAPAASAHSSSSGRPTQQQMAAYQQQQRAAQQQQQQQQRNARENRFELFYSKSSKYSLQRAEVIMQGLSNYFPDGFIRQHVLAINFDDENNIGRVHEVILNSEKYLSIIQVDCILFDKFENYIILPEYNILKILKNHCQSCAPKQTTPPGDRQIQMDREKQQAMYEQEQAEAQAQADAEERRRAPFNGARRATVDAMNRRRPIVDTQDAVPMPPRGMAGFSAMAKQVGADLNSPASEVKLQHIVPSGSNSLMTAETLEEVEALPASNMSLIYGQSKGCTLGYGNDLARIEQDFVAAHNAANKTEREITSQSMAKVKKQRGETLSTQRAPPRAPAPLAGPNLQHLQGLERSPTNELGGKPASKAESEQMGKLKQLKVTKTKQPAAAN